MSLTNFISAFRPQINRQPQSRRSDRTERKNRDKSISANAGSLQEPTVPWAVYFASFVINLLALSLPLSIMQVYDRVIPNRSLSTLAWLFFGLAVALFIDFLLKASRSTLLSWQAARFARNVENEAVARFLRAPNGAFEREPAAVRSSPSGRLNIF